MLRNNDLLNFKDYFNVNFNTDSENQIYPDVSQLMDKIPSSGDKKKKKGEMPDFIGKDKKKF
jgi:hypothetical protein